MDMSLEGRAQREQEHQIYKARKAVGEVVEALRVALAVANPSVNNSALEITHAEAQTLASLIVKL